MRRTFWVSLEAHNCFGGGARCRFMDTRLHRAAVTGKTIKLGAYSWCDSQQSRLLSGDYPSPFTGNHKGSRLDVYFGDYLVDSFRVQPETGVMLVMDWLTSTASHHTQRPRFRIQDNETLAKIWSEVSLVKLSAVMENLRGQGWNGIP